MSYRKPLTAFILTLFFSGLVWAGSLLDPNAASREELAAIGELNADAIDSIIAVRPFATIGDLNSALRETMTQDQLEQLYGKLFVAIDLNTASRADILLIPGVGPRMAHEFEEYRPYTSMDQFRREIGKYVSEEEVARLEMYITLD